MMILRLMSTWSQGGFIHPAAGSPGVFFLVTKKTMTWRGSPGGIFKGGSKLNQSWFHPHPTLPKTNSGLRTLESMMGKEKLYTFPFGFFSAYLQGLLLLNFQGVKLGVFTLRINDAARITEVHSSQTWYLLNDWRCLHMHKIRII